MESNNTSDATNKSPDQQQDDSLTASLVAEAKYHLLPWGAGYFSQRTSVVAAGIGLAVVVTIFWILAAAGRTAPVLTIAWWAGWSVYECICRMRWKPSIKEGPWWGHAYRRASLPDIIAYVLTKNLLIGAMLYLLVYLSLALLK